ncbi:hypothetical protein MPER_12960 [Moniliophthora perniciosa FA553]|nr:hypothetical protein MPER_12960 [Moniliophthora perniciosa FA553]
MYDMDERKILYTLSHMSGGTAETWKNNALDEIFDEEKDDDKELTFETFENKFRERFEPFDKVATAQRKLETLRMKRDEGGADEYVNKFRELANKTKFDDAALIVYFRRGLPENLMRRIMSHTPRPETIDDWMDLAKLHDGIYQETTYAINRDREIVNRQQNLRRNIAKNVGKIELQINRLSEAERQDYMKKGLCFYCSKTGHRERKKPSAAETFAKIRALTGEMELEEKDKINSIHLSLMYKVGNKNAEIKALIDSGAGGRFISLDFAKTLGKRWNKLRKPIKVYNVDGTPNKTAMITHSVLFEYSSGTKTFCEEFMISGLGKEKLILGLPWLQNHNPNIDWVTGEVVFRPNRKLRIRQFTGILDTTPPEILIQAKQIEEVHIRAKTSTSQTLAQAQEEKKRSLEELIPSYLLDFRSQFEKGKAERFPESRPYDHAIELKPDYVPKKQGLYRLNETETKVMEEFINENLRKKYIRPSVSPIAAPFFFVSKKEKGALRPCQDYRDLNSGTVKNAYPLPLVGKLLDKLKGATIFSKLDLRNGYNNIRIKDGDQWKAAFRTEKGLFEPMVMFFGLANSPATFQAFMDDTLSDFIGEGCQSRFIS